MWLLASMTVATKSSAPKRTCVDLLNLFVFPFCVTLSLAIMSNRRKCVVKQEEKEPHQHYFHSNEFASFARKGMTYLAETLNKSI